MQHIYANNIYKGDYTHTTKWKESVEG